MELKGEAVAIAGYAGDIRRRRYFVMEGPVDLGASLESYVDRLVQEGGFASREDVLREGVRQMQEGERAVRLAELEESLRQGIEDAKAGRVRDLDEVADELCSEYQAMSGMRAKA